MSINKFDLIIFDCDGTLVDTEAVNCQVTLDLVNGLSGSNYTKEYAQKEWSGHLLESILLSVQMETGYRFPDNTVNLYTDRCLELYDTLVGPVDHSLELVRACAGKTKICVASNGERSKVLKALGLSGLRPDYFTEEIIFTKDQVKTGKPAPDLFLHAAQKMGFDPTRCLVVEDSVPGIMAAVSAGMTAWGFTGTHYEPEIHVKTLKSAGAHEVFGSLIHIRERLSR